MRGETGRPSLAPPFAATGLHFNLAHTHGLVVLAAGRVAGVGVDVEALGKRVRLEVAERYFSAAEVAELSALPVDARAARFLRLWTLKESYLKATGQGGFVIANPSGTNLRTAIRAVARPNPTP